jgi:hypothetical protein
MRNISDQIVLSATDLSNFLNCRHRTALELGEARGKRPRPYFHDPVLEALFARGLEHEHQYVEALECAGRRIVNLAEIRDRTEARDRKAGSGLALQHPAYIKLLGCRERQFPGQYTAIDE